MSEIPNTIRIFNMDFETKALLIVCGIVTLISGGAALYAKFYMKDVKESLGQEDSHDQLKNNKRTHD